jgi:hypothetical protein
MSEAAEVDFREELRHVFRQSGIPVTENQLAQLPGAYQRLLHVMAVLRRRDRPARTEPLPVYRARERAE